MKLAILTLLLAGCVAAVPATGPGLPVVVRNHNHLRATLYDGPRRLGDVEPLQVRTLALPPGLPGYRLRVRLLGSTRVHEFPAVRVDPGDTLEIVIANYLPQSTLVVR